jgi:hypothetical protein
MSRASGSGESTPDSDVWTSSHLPTSSPQDQRVLQVEEFFRYRPPTLVPAVNHTKSTGTRPPQPFDKHLDESLRLRRIAYLPSIKDDLERVADSALQSASSTLPPIRDPFPGPRRRNANFVLAPVFKIRNERSLESIYGLTTAIFCMVVAVTLEFRYSSWTAGYLEWTKDTRSSSGVGDAFLNLNDTYQNTNLAPLPDPYRKVAEDFENLVVYEFKSLIAGCLKNLQAIVQQSAIPEVFPWEGCDHGKLCAATCKGRNGRPGPYRTGHKMGFDADSPPCESVRPENRVVSDSPSYKPAAAAKRHARYIIQQVNIFSPSLLIFILLNLNAYI